MGFPHGKSFRLRFWNFHGDLGSFETWVTPKGLKSHLCFKMTINWGTPGLKKKKHAYLAVQP
jgi:hypothetical protein